DGFVIRFIPTDISVYALTLNSYRFFHLGKVLEKKALKLVPFIRVFTHSRNFSSIRIINQCFEAALQALMHVAGFHNLFLAHSLHPLPPLANTVLALVGSVMDFLFRWIH